MIEWEEHEKTKYSKAKCFLHISRETEINTFPKTQNIGIVNLLSTGKLWEIMFRSFRFLIPHSFISRELETHSVPKIWGKWLLIVRQTHGKTRIFQSYRFLTYFIWSTDRYNSQNMGKMNSHSKEKTWENSIFFWLKQKSMQFPK